MIINNDNDKKVYKIKSNETLRGIAEKKLGDANRWKEITKKGRSSFTEKEAKNLHVGEEIYIPKEKIVTNKKEDKRIVSESNITHKELLTFSNLTNLEWQFVDLTPEEKNGDLVYSKLNGILSNPKSFVETDDEGNILAYQYGADDEGNFTNKEQGLAEMRREAGIAMEYLEKEAAGNFEAQFSKDWRE